MLALGVVVVFVVLFVGDEVEGNRALLFRSGVE